LEVKVSTLEDEKSGLFREIRDLQRQLEERRVKLREAEERLEREILGLETRCKEL
jgi:predicted  nucleic acid-binding Zn-ribbon protein